MAGILHLWLSSMKWVLIFVPPMMVLTFAALPIVDRAKPWNPADRELATREPGAIRYCVGITSSLYRETGAMVRETQRSYLLVNRLKLATITERIKNGKSEIAFETDRVLFWVLPTFFLILIVLSIRVCLPRIKKAFLQT